MFVDHRCVGCRRLLRIAEWNRGKSLRCPDCATALVFPSSCSQETEARTIGRPASCARPDSPPNRLLLPWLLLLPAVMPLALWMWTGHGVLWAGLGVGLGGFCLLLGQRGRWPVSLRIAVSLSCALLGHGLTLASPWHGRSQHRDPSSHTSAATPSLDPCLLLETGQKVLISSSSDVEELLLRGLRHETTNRPSPLDFRPATQIGELLAATADVEANGDGLVVAATRDGTIKEFTYPDFVLRATHRLDGAAYRLALDGRRRVLWATVCRIDKLQANRYGDQPLGRADLHVYDLSCGTNERLHPRRILLIGGNVLELLLSPDQSALFYLAQTDDGVSLGRLDTARQALDCRVALPEETNALCLSPNGRTLYAAGGGSVRVLDAATLRTTQRLEVKTNAFAIAANNEGCVYLAERGQWTNLTRLDLRESQPTLHQWSARLHGRIYLKMSPDQYRLYVGSSSVVSDHLDALLIRGHSWIAPPLLAMNLSTPETPVQGEFFLTPDGRFLINRWGQVFHLAQGKVMMPLASPGGSLVFGVK